MAVAAFLLWAPSALASGERAAASCGLPDSTPLWIDYGGPGVTADVHAVLARPGVVVSSSGKDAPADFRSHGAATTYFELHLPDLVGEPTDPADPSSIASAGAKLLARAQSSTACATPWIALNELFGSNLPAPWSATNTVYRANVLALIQQLAAGGARPFLLVHGDYYLGGATAAWWRDVAQSGEIVYEAYYNASHISELGPLMGNRRMRHGMRSFVADYGAIGIPAARLGVMLGFHSALTPGTGGRQGLAPREAWLRAVKWEVLAARQVATDTGLSTIWSWGWGTFGPPSVDLDKAAAACVYLWTRESSLCDGAQIAGPSFNASMVEGQIALADGVQCSLAGNRISTRLVRQLGAVTRNRHDALTALFARASLEAAVPIAEPQVLATEQQVIASAFHGNRDAYLRALHRRHATVDIARGAIRDELRRRAIASMLARQGIAESVLQWTDDIESRASDNAICRRDVLPGSGNFPATDTLEIGVVPLPALLPFLFRDRTAPATPSPPTATLANQAVSVAWNYGGEADLAGYDIFRATAPEGPYTRLNPTLLSRPSFVDSAAPPGSTSYYVVRAVDSSGNLSNPTQAISATPS
jgi:hypothetical protein